MMLSAQTLIQEALALPIEQRSLIIETLIESINQPNSDIDRQWIEISKSRLNDLKSGKVKGTPGDEVFHRIWERFSK